MQLFECLLCYAQAIPTQPAVIPPGRVPSPGELAARKDAARLGLRWGNGHMDAFSGALAMQQALADRLYEEGYGKYTFWHESRPFHLWRGSHPFHASSQHESPQDHAQPKKRPMVLAKGSAGGAPKKRPMLVGTCPGGSAGGAPVQRPASHALSTEASPSPEPPSSPQPESSLSADPIQSADDFEQALEDCNSS